MANYKLMIHYINSVDNDIRELEKLKGSKAVVKHLVRLQEYMKGAWAKIHSIVKSMDETSSKANYNKSQEIIASCLDMNLQLNDYYNKLTNLGIKRKEKGDPDLLNYILEEMFFNYSMFLDALHFMGVYYIPAETFPFILTDMFTQRKMEQFANGMEGGDEEGD